jgi:curved DNA-binding protein
LEYKDYYKTLGVEKTASADEIQKAYRKLARKHHPDVNKEEGAEDRFKEIGEAYEVLKDEDKRKHYDRFGSAWKQAQNQGGGAPPGWEGFDFGNRGGGGGRGGVHFDFGNMGGGGGAEFSDFFEMLFGGRGARGPDGPGFAGQTRGPGSRRGRDMEAPISLSLEDAARGARRELLLTDPSTGRRKTVSVNIPAGLKHGQKVRLAGQGQEGLGEGGRGDLLLRIELAPDDRFELDGDDVTTDLAISPWEAALGGKARLPTLDGDVTVKIPAGSSSGQKIRLRGKGYPKGSQNGSERGDLYATLRIRVPKDLSNEERELFEKLAEVSDFDARA